MGLQSSTMLVQDLLLKLLKCSVLINKSQTWKKLSEKTWRHKMFSTIIWSSLTRENKKDTLVDAAARGRFIALLFHSFESSSKRSHFSQNDWLHRFRWFYVTLEVNTQRNKSSLLCTKSSGNTHFWMKHFNRPEVVTRIWV